MTQLTELAIELEQDRTTLERELAEIELLMRQGLQKLSATNSAVSRPRSG